LKEEVERKEEEIGRLKGEVVVVQERARMEMMKEREALGRVVSTTTTMMGEQMGMAAADLESSLMRERGLAMRRLFQVGVEAEKRMEKVLREEREQHRLVVERYEESMAVVDGERGQETMALRDEAVAFRYV